MVRADGHLDPSLQKFRNGSHLNVAIGVVEAGAGTSHHFDVELVKQNQLFRA